MYIAHVHYITDPTCIVMCVCVCRLLQSIKNIIWGIIKLFGTQNSCTVIELI